MFTHMPRPRLDRLIGLAALGAVFSLPLARAAAAASPAVPPALQPALYAALAKDTGSAYAIGPHGCATLKTQPLTACFGKGGARFRGQDAPPVWLHLAAYGRGQALTSVKPVAPTIRGNRASYAHGAVTEWWRVLPVGFEQGFTIAQRPAGDGELTMALTTSSEAIAKGGAIAIGKLRYGHLVVTDITGKVVPSTLTTKNGRILIAVNDVKAIYPLTIDPLVWNEQKVTADDGAAGDQFGYAVAISGTTAVVGAKEAAIGANLYQGAAYVFTYSGGSWTQTAKLIADDGAANNRFGASVAVSGTTIVVGAYGATVGANYAQGAAYVFDGSGGTWTQTAKLTASDGATFDEFGWSAALSGNTAVIGSYNATVNGNPAQGAAWVFENSNGTWAQTAKLTASDGIAYDEFGYSVAISGNAALVGEPYATVSGNYAQGAGYLFSDSDGTWTQVAKLTASDGAEGDAAGWSVALSGATALIGAPYAIVGSNDYQGAVWVFDDMGGTWIQQQKLTAEDGSANDAFGWSVALEGNTALIGAAADYMGTIPGAAYLFVRAGAVWGQTAELTPSDGVVGDQFGYSVALSGINSLAGAPFADIGDNTDQGAAYFYTATCPQGYGEHDGTLSAGGLYGSTPYQAPAGIENGILGGPAGFRLYAQYSNGTTQHLYRIPGNEIHKLGPAGTYRWGVKAGNTGGAYVLCILHP